MKSLEIGIYVLFVFAIFFAFGLIYISLIFLLVTFYLIGKVKKYDKKLAKKLNYVAVGILVLNIVIFILSGILVSLFLNELLSRATITPG
jgi:cbb3-type cytochrome oxidase subunit 3